MILLVHIVHTRGQTGLGDAQHLEHGPNRQPPDRDDPWAGCLRLRHPCRYPQRPAIGAADDEVDLVEKLVLPDYWQALPSEGMKAIVDRNLLSALLMGIMWLSCLSP